MKNYGLCRKCFHEDFLYRYAKTRAKILSILPGRNKKLWKRNYEDIFDNYYRIGDHDNSLPENHFMNLRTIITADLVHREDIKMAFVICLRQEGQIAFLIFTLMG